MSLWVNRATYSRSAAVAVAHGSRHRATTRSTTIVASSAPAV